MAGALQTRFQPIRAMLAKWDGEGLTPDQAPADWLHRWLPVAIVLVSLGAAAMAWQASVAEERATHKDVLGRQDLVREQELDLEKTQEVDADLRVFGEYERAYFLSEVLRHDRLRMGGSARRTLAAAAAADEAVLGPLEPQLSGVQGVGAGAPYNARIALRVAKSGDRDLTSLEPGRLRQAARHQRVMALHLTGLLVVFVVGLVFLTLAAVARSRLSYWFAGGGVSAALIATSLFFVVRVV